MTIILFCNFVSLVRQVEGIVQFQLNAVVSPGFAQRVEVQCAHMLAEKVPVNEQGNSPKKAESLYCLFGKVGT